MDKCNDCYLRYHCDEPTEWICKSNDYCKYMPEQSNKNKEVKNITVFEQYKTEVGELINTLGNIRYCDVNYSDEIFPLIVRATKKLKEMLEIIENTSIANGAMAAALQAMSKE